MVKQLNYSPGKKYLNKQSKEPNKWLLRLDIIIEKYAGEATLDNERLAKELAVSERNLFRKVKEITGMSPQKYLRQYRLHQAIKYLKNGRYRTVKETANAVGYSNVSYFISIFESVFGVRPFQILQDEGWR